jgi:hypothetical protein
LTQLGFGHFIIRIRKDAWAPARTILLHGGNFTYFMYFIISSVFAFLFIYIHFFMGVSFFRILDEGLGVELFAGTQNIGCSGPHITVMLHSLGISRNFPKGNFYLDACP